MHSTSDTAIATPPLCFVRHGATQANLAGLRCGGDLDLPLTETGRRQAETAARNVAARMPRVGLIITSDLQRTRETAAIIAAALRGTPIVVEPDLRERSLGDWNLRPLAETQAWLEARHTPPGGESEEEFALRITRGLRRIKGRLQDRPLLVGSKGVARVMGELIGWPGRLALANGEVAEFDLAFRPFLATTWGMP
jgi:probable phosphoglycerate mutase